jgi:hypothetical protein
MSDRVVVERFVEEVMNAGNLDAADGLMDPDHVDHDPTAPEVGRGHEGVKELISTYREAFPDSRVHTGEKVEVSGVEINHVRDGRISASYTVSDALGLMRQVGAL